MPGGDEGKTRRRRRLAKPIGLFLALCGGLVLVLVIFAGLIWSTRPLDLPPVPAGRKAPPHLTLHIEKDGRILVDHRIRTSPAKVTEDLRAAGITRDETLLVTADPEASYDQLMAALDALEKGGFAKVGLMSDDLSGAR